MPTDKQLMQQALDALEAHADIGIKATKQIEALRARLAQPEPEPVAWGIANTRPTEKNPLMMVMLDEPEPSHLVVPLYRVPPQRKEEPEPVAWHEPGAYGNVTVYEGWAKENGWLPLYTAPPQREWCQCEDAPNDCTYAKNCRVPQIDAAFKRSEWQGLTDEEIMKMLDYGQHGRVPAYARNFVDAIEAKLKEKNSGNA